MGRLLLFLYSIDSENIYNTMHSKTIIHNDKKYSKTRPKSSVWLVSTRFLEFFHPGFVMFKLLTKLGEV